MNPTRILLFTFLLCASVMNGFAQKSVTYKGVKTNCVN